MLSFRLPTFTMWVFKPRTDPIQLSTSGADLSGPMRAALSAVTPGTKVFFTNVVAVGPDGTQRGLKDIVLSAN